MDTPAEHTNGPIKSGLKAVGALLAGIANGATGTPIPPNTDPMTGPATDPDTDTPTNPDTEPAATQTPESVERLNSARQEPRSSSW